jgi:hypothetical protein
VAFKERIPQRHGGAEKKKAISKEARKAGSVVSNLHFMASWIP